MELVCGALPRRSIGRESGDVALTTSDRWLMTASPFGLMWFRFVFGAEPATPVVVVTSDFGFVMGASRYRGVDHHNLFYIILFYILLLVVPATDPWTANEYDCVGPSWPSMLPRCAPGW